MSSITAGTTSTTTLVHSGDTTGSLVFKTNDTGSGGTTAVTLDTSQNATFAGKVTSAGALTLASNGTTTAVTIDTSQNVGIGTTSPSSFGKLAIQVAGTTTPTNATNVGPSSINLYAATNGGSTDSTTGIFGWQASQPGIGSGIGFSRENASDWGTQLRFYTHPTSTSNIGDITERMRISSTGAVSIGTTSTYNSSNLSVNGRIASTTPFFSGGNGGSFWQSGSDGISGTPSYIVYNGNGSGVFLAWGNTSWSANSDERIKTDLTPIENAIQKVSTLRTVTGRYKIDKEGTSRLFLIAQDVQKVFPEAISIQNDTQGTLGLAYTDLIPVLVAAIKEQQALITAQAETINALTARIVALEGQ